MVYHLKPLRTALKTPLLSLLLLLSAGAFAQDTVYQTYSAPEEKEYGVFFTQVALGVPLNLNPHRGEVDPATGESGSWFIPDGISLHGGAGIHLKKWIGISANTGIDWRIKQKLVSVPIYGMLTVNPHFNKETSILLQAGLGQAYALGRGNLNGTYQKYRLGIMFDDDMCIFIDGSLFGYPLKDIRETGTFTIGLGLFNF